MSTSSFWLVIVVVGLGTVAMRTVPLLAHGRIKTPPVVERLLKHVPAAALAALAVPSSIYLKTNGAYEFAPERAIAAVVALLVALKWRNVVLTLAVGMGVLWALQWLMG